MSTVLYVGMDVHSTSYSLATFALGDREARFELKIEPDYEQVLQYLGTVRRQVADALGEVEFVCGYWGRWNSSAAMRQAVWATPCIIS